MIIFSQNHGPIYDHKVSFPFEKFALVTSKTDYFSYFLGFWVFKVDPNVGLDVCDDSLRSVVLNYCVN